MGWTLSTGWSSGIRSEVQTFSGAGLPTVFGGSNTTSTGIVRTDVDANRTLVTDQASKQRISKSNALGQLTDVYEIMAASDASTSSVTFPNTSIAYGYVTSYVYDTLNNLTTVNQGSQTRTFAYNSLSRLTSATNPESGTINYVYDNNGNLTSKVDATSITTSYVYDALNRVTDRNYTNEPSGSETPDVDYFYGTTAPKVGKLTKVTSSVSTTEYTSFDIIGRVTGHKQSTDGTDYTTGYTYKLSGALDEQTYPSGRVVKNELDVSGDLASVTSKENSSAIVKTYANDFAYNAAGAVTSLKLGNGRFETTTFNSRLQPTQIRLGTSETTQNILKLEYGFGTTANNGNVLSQTITVPTVGANTGFVAAQTYAYDELNRLKSATENVTPHGGSQSQSWKQAYTFDRYGNRRFDFTGGNTTSPASNCTEAICNPTVSTTNNRLTSTGWQYDDAGNTTRDAEYRTFTYDGENKQTLVKNSSNATIGEYFYDGDGKRVKKVVPSTGETTVFVYDAAGKLIGEYSTIVASANDAKVAYLTNDHLGSPRITTDAIGQTTSRRDFMPYGEEIARSNYGSDAVREKFATYERDAETDLDFAQARTFRATIGRFTSPDPLNSSGREDSPTSWNRYVYVLNNPLVLVDPTGLYDWDASLKDDVSLDKKTREERKKLRDAFTNGLTKARTDAAKLLASGKLSQGRYDQIMKAIDSYGSEGDSNGVTLGVSVSKPGNLGETNPTFNYTQDRTDQNGGDTFKASIEVKLDAKTLLGSNASDLILHEGSHVADAQAYGDKFLGWTYNGPLNVTQYQSEVNAFKLNSYMYEANSSKSPFLPVWDNKWTKSASGRLEADRQASIDAYVLANYKAQFGGALSKSNPGVTLSSSIKVQYK